MGAIMLGSLVLLSAVLHMPNLSKTCSKIFVTPKTYSKLFVTPSETLVIVQSRMLLLDPPKSAKPRGWLLGREFCVSQDCCGVSHPLAITTSV